jgi:hypothetical protein
MLLVAQQRCVYRVAADEDFALLALATDRDSTAVAHLLAAVAG